MSNFLFYLWMGAGLCGIGNIFVLCFGFTFTNPVDFTPLTTLVFGCALAFAIHFSQPKPASPVLKASLLLLSFWPLLPHLGLYFLAHEFQRVNGSWPQIMVDDPKNQLGQTSPLYDTLFGAVTYFEAFSGAWLIIFALLYPLLKSRFSRRWRGLIIGANVCAILVMLFDPGALYAWWLD